jgi:hypothetical protein
MKTRFLGPLRPAVTREVNRTESHNQNCGSKEA